MMEILQFAMKDGWHFFGTLILICAPIAVAGESIASIVLACKGKAPPG